MLKFQDLFDYETSLTASLSAQGNPSLCYKVLIYFHYVVTVVVVCKQVHSRDSIALTPPLGENKKEMNNKKQKPFS